MKVQKGLKRLTAKFTNTVFCVYQLFLLKLSSKNKLRILFSDKQGWKRPIKGGFQFTPYEVNFGELSHENFKEYDLIVPLTIPDLKYLNEKYNSIKHNSIPIPNAKIIQLCNNKYTFNQYLIANGFGEFVPRMGVTKTFPYILKKKIGEWGENCYIISNVQQEQRVTEFLKHPQYFTQELITGSTEYATHIFFKDRKIVCALNIEYAFEIGTPIKGKDSAIYEKICHCPYLDLFSAILFSIDFEGICCINYKVIDDRPFVIEINPRFGGSLCPYFFSFMRHIN